MILRTLGGLALEGTGFRRPKPLLLLTYLSLEGPTERRYLSELFWMEAANSRRSLTTALTQLRRGAPGTVDSDDVRVCSEVQCDALQMLRAGEEGNWLRVLELYSGPFLDGIELGKEGIELEEWVYGTRDSVSRCAGRAMLELGEKAAGEARFEEVRNWAERAASLAVTAPPSDDDLARLYTLLLASESPKIDAVREDGLSLGLELPTSKDAARRSLLARAAASAAQPLPASTTSFIGREQELAELAGLLEEPAVRLLSIVGAGGTGKSRLSLQLAHEQSESRAWNAVHFVPLESVGEVAGVAPALADVLGVHLQDQQDPVSQLSLAIGNSPRLVVLDNFEHLLAAAPLLADLVRACPLLRLVVTSRERLNLEEENVYLVDGLPCPSEPVDSPEQALQFAAVTLFVQRARRSQPGFTLAGAPVADVVRICVLVGGMPLALEMAASWARAMSCGEIADELERGLDLLESTSRDRPERHQTVRLAFEHSWKLLSPNEQSVMMGLSVFRGGFAREAAARVTGASLVRLASLIDRSLLSWNGSGRYHLHPLLQQFLEEKAGLHPDELYGARGQHAEYFLSKLAMFEDAFPHREAGTAAADIESDLANFLAAWEWAAQQRHHSLLENAIRSLGWYFLLRGRFQQGRSWIEIATNAEPVSLLALRQFHWRGAFLGKLGQVPAAKECIRQAIDLAERLGARTDLANGLRLAGVNTTQQEPLNGMSPEAAWRRALAVYEELGDREGVAMMLNNLALVAPSPTDSLTTLHEALAIAEEAVETHATAMISASLAELLLRSFGDYEGARTAVEQSRSSHEETGFRLYRAMSILMHCEVLIAAGDLAGAERLSADTVELADSFPPSTAAQLRAVAAALLGDSARVRGQLESADDYYRQSIRLLTKDGSDEMVVWGPLLSLNGLASIARVRRRPDEVRLHANEGLELVEEHSNDSSSFMSAMCLVLMVRVGEALTLEREHEMAEKHLLGVLRRAHDEGSVPTVLETLMALAEVKLGQGKVPDARALFAGVAAHSASPFELAGRARTALEALASSGSQVEEVDASLPAMISLALDTDSAGRPSA